MKKLGWVFWLISIIATASALTTVLFYYSKFGLITRYDINATDKWGQFGDYIGGTLNPVLGLLSLIVLLLVYVQNKEELKDTRKVLAEQSETLKIQRFEQTFFSLLNLYSKIAANVEAQGDNARGGFHDLYVNDLSIFIGSGSFESEKKCRLNRLNSLSNFRVLYCDSNQFNIKYKQFAIEMENYISHYFRIVYSILKFISNSDISDKKLYANLLRAQLSKYELLLLFYNNISDFGVDKFFPLLIEFDILQHLNKDFLFDKEIDLQIFEELKKSIK